MKRKFPPDFFSIHFWGPIGIAGIYLIVGALWILFSDQLATEIAPDQSTLTKISIYKGWGYVLVTALMLYSLIRSHTMAITRAEQQLRESEENYRELLNQASDGIFIADPNGQYILVNEEACNLVGYSRRELLSMHLRDLIAPEELEATPLRLDELRNGQTVISERTLVHKNGARILCELSSRILPDGRFQSSVRDITERKMSEAALVRSESRYRSLFENMTSGYARYQMVYDENGKPVDFIYLDVNFAFKRLTGFDNVVGRHVIDIMPDIKQTNPELFEIYGRVASTGITEKFETFMPGLGEGVWFSIAAYSIERDFFVTMFDVITERKRAEEKLRDSESRYRELVQNANSAILRWRRDGVITFFNEYAEKFFGYDSEEVIGRDVNILVPDTESVGGDLSNLVESIVAHPEQFVNVVNENVCSDGRRVWVAWTNQPVYDENDQLVEILAVGVDITERKHAQELLEESHKQLLSFIEQAPLSIAMFDRDMNYLSVSHRWVLDFGRGYTDLIGRNHYNVHPDIPEAWKIAHQDGLAGESLKNDDDVWMQTDGTKFWLRWAITPWTDEHGEIGGIIISAEDISERKRAEAAAFQNELRYHRVLDAMMEGCQIIDFDWRYVYVNDVVAEQGKYKPEELLNHTMMEMYPGIEQTDMFAVLQKCMAEREPQRMENEFVFPDGSIGWFELSIQPAQEGLFILSTDITERKKSEKIIHDLARFPEENPNPVLRANANGEIVYANLGSAGLLKEWGIEVNDPLPEKWMNVVVDVYTSGNSQSLDVPVRNQTFETIFVPIREAGYVNIYSHDVTERKQAEEALRRSEERLRLSLQAANQGLYDLNVQTGDAVVNREYAEMLGYDFKTFVETNAAWIERLHPEDQEITAKAYSDYVNGLKPEYRVEFRQKTKNGGWKWILSLGKVIEYDKNGKPLRMLGTHTDITERKQSEEQIRRLNEELEQRVIERTSQLDAANKELEAFAYSVSHDLRAPLRAIDGFTQILMEDYEPQLDDEGSRVCGVIRRETERMGQLIDDLLSFSRLSRKEMHSDLVDMRELADSVFKGLISEADQNRIDFHLGDIPNGPCDVNLLRQVWTNLIENAIKFTSGTKRSVIEVGGTQNGDENVYFVRDNGAGFDMEYVGKLFGVFQRLHSEKEFEGTGVGLAIVQRVVHRHGGRVWAEGKVDQGATFYFTLPRKGYES